MKGLIGILARRGVDDIGDGEEFGRKFDVRLVAEQAAEEFLGRYGELLSAFQLTGDFGLWATMDAYIRTHGLLPECAESVQDGDAVGYRKAILATQMAAFVDLYENRNAIGRLQLVTPLPPEAAAQYVKMRNAVKASAPVVAQVVEETPAPPAVVESPVEICAREFREMPSQEWKKKWLNNRNNRPVTDQAAAEGRLG